MTSSTAVIEEGGPTKDASVDAGLWLLSDDKGAVLGSSTDLSLFLLASLRSLSNSGLWVC
jgi:hypothetical protein